MLNGVATLLGMGTDSGISQSGLDSREELASYYGRQTIRNLRTRRTSNKHDHVYALHGVLNLAYNQAPPLPDYGRPLDLVYEFFAYLLTTHDLFLNLIVDSGMHQALPGAPSWLPDWSTPLEKRTWLSHEYLFKQSVSAIRHDGKDGHMRTSIGEIEILCQIERRALKVSAAFHCSLVFCGTLDDQALQDLLANAIANAIANALAAQSSPEDVTIDKSAEDFTSDMSALTLLYKWLKASPSLQVFDDTLDPIWIVLAMFDHDGTSRIRKGKGLLSQDRPPIAWLQLLLCIRDALDEPWAQLYTREAEAASGHLLLAVSDEPDVLDLLRQFTRSIRGRRSVFTSEDGHIGSGPLSMKLGDRIAFIAGLEIPMALRPREPTNGMENCYSVVGPVLFSPREVGPVEADWSTREAINLI